nr:MAG: Protein of unknown function (DUF1642) [Bacteriophage sp.]
MTKQKLYKVRFKDIGGFNLYYLNYDVKDKYWSINIDIEEEGTLFRTSFTKEELKEAGFEWVFNSPLVEVWELL